MPPTPHPPSHHHPHSHSHSPHRPIDPKIWRACAGNSVQIPILHSRVYYFPQGHLEQSSSSAPLLLSPLVLSKPLILCRISAVHFVADPTTDEVFAKLLLLPIPNHEPTNRHEPPNDDVFDDADETDKVVSFAKILTPSDANNGGGFSVPRFCADSIFPALNYQAEPPVQTLSVTDLHGVVWDFRHIYRGTPRRHLLTTGWSKFVNHKMLVAGDSVVFMRNSRGEMFVGVRRAVRSTVSSDCASRWSSHIGGGATTTMRLKTEDQEGSGRKVMSAEAVVGAAEMAAAGRPFEVVYYPKAGWSDFVVKAEVVEKALNVFWSAGMRVKMSVETEDSSRMTWFQGTLSSVSIPDNGPWQRSPWRMLQVTWDEPEVLQNAKRVSPWQVDYVASTPSIHTAFPPAKRFRAPMSPGLLTNAEEEFFFPVPGAPNSTMGQLNASLLNYNTFPAGMQGARQDLYCVSNLSHLLSENTPQMCTYNSFGNNVVPKLKRVSTELNIGSSQSDELSPDSQSSVHSFGTELDGNRYCNSTKVGRSSFQLFGKIIHMNQPVEGGFDDVGCTEDNGNKGYNATEGVNNQLNLSYSKLLERLDVQYQRASAVEACSL
ncbi:unnamed protein product [Prunus armeniaca]|uniref:Auxin response factor n=1 Tax=Prunus armeniaca TaxID=36596 RepID=A0A6J5WB33_PRUAR|nr:unnamed protein product [Prunus armeniaca]